MTTLLLLENYHLSPIDFTMEVDPPSLPPSLPPWGAATLAVSRVVGSYCDNSRNNSSCHVVSGGTIFSRFWRPPGYPGPTLLKHLSCNAWAQLCLERCGGWGSVSLHTALRPGQNKVTERTTISSIFFSEV